MTTVQASVPVTASERVSDVLARDEALVEVFVRHAPHFAKLRNRALRRVMARLVTVEQAARTARVPVAQLLCDLNHALGFRTEPDDVAPAELSRDGEGVDERHPDGAPEVELDVRDDLRVGREPFSAIMRTIAALRPGEVFHLRTLFEPVPLFTVLAKRGFKHESLSRAPDDWSVWFWLPAHAEPSAAQTSAAAPISVIPTEDDATTVWLDVRGASPPAPMIRTLTALDVLPRGHVLVQINSRVPEFLFPVLAERGFAWQVDDSRIDRVLVRIWHART
ncbi:MAG TPA: DUF2249 domain-containing protein [Gemmatimonadaceae bacterium]|nr:DUF2249 domain-containing protein [Gemmatimonadaceae bacterium]